MPLKFDPAGLVEEAGADWPSHPRQRSFHPYRHSTSLPFPSGSHVRRNHLDHSDRIHQCFEVPGGEAHYLVDRPICRRWESATVASPDSLDEFSFVLTSLTEVFEMIDHAQIVLVK